MSDRPLLEVADLRVTFVQYERGLRRRVVEAITSMDLTVAPGEVVAVVGASGAGKTLLAHAVLGILPSNAVEAGQVRLDGRPVSPRERRSRAGRDISLLPQAVSYLDPMADVGPQLRRAARLAGRADPAAAADQALAARNLPAEVARRRPHELSGGMVRRVLEAIATMGTPRLLFADEPTPGLHPDEAAATLARLRALADEGTAVVLITHDLPGALTVADRVTVCRSGRTIEGAPVSAFQGDGDDLAEPYSRALWRALPANGFHLPDRPRRRPDGRSPERPGLGRGPRLRAHDLWFGYERRGPWVLSGASLDLAPGEVVGLQGPSGCGKSTLGRILAGLLRPDHGRVELDGPAAAGGVNPVQMVVQHAEAAMNPRWPIGKVLAEAGADRVTRDEIEAGIIEPAWHDRRPHELSGGELQRVNLARALLARPRYLVADEITSSLDPLTQAEIWHAVVAHCRHHDIGLLVISHDAPLLAAITDRTTTLAELTPAAEPQPDRPSGGSEPLGSQDEVSSARTASTVSASVGDLSGR